MLAVLDQRYGVVQLGYFGQPFPICVLVARLAKMRIALQRRPGPMARVCSDMRYVQAEFEQPRNAVMPKIVKMQVRDLKQFAGACEPGTDRIR